MNCKNEPKCTFCSKSHEYYSCPDKNSPAQSICINCEQKETGKGKGHHAFSKKCPLYKAEEEKLISKTNWGDLPYLMKKDWLGLKKVSIKKNVSMNLDIITTNCRSLLPKLDELKILCHLYNPNYVFLSETWLNTAKPNKLLKIEHYNWLRADRKYRRGTHENIVLMLIAN